jgi:hypothetical protein
MRRLSYFLIADPTNKSTLLFRDEGTKAWTPIWAELLGPNPVAAQQAASTDTGLDFEIMYALGSPQTLPNGDEAYAFACRLKGGQLRMPRQYELAAYCTAEEVRAGNYFRRGQDWEAIRCSAGANLRLVLAHEPADALGVVGRMVWDHLSLMGEPSVNFSPFDDPDFAGFETLPEGSLGWKKTFVMKRAGKRAEFWPRLDPYKR